MTADTLLESWFLHNELALAVIGPEETRLLKFPASEHPFSRAINRTIISRAIWEHVAQNKIPSGANQIREGVIQEGRLIWFEQAFYFKDAVASHRSKGVKRATFHGKLDVDQSVEIRGAFNGTRVTSDTALTVLTGRAARIFVVAYVTAVSASLVTIRPVVIANRLISDGPTNVPYGDRARVWPQEVDQFRGVNFDLRLTKRDLQTLKDIPEQVVKNAFAQILSEPTVPKDWGGEQFDTWTSHHTGRGAPSSCHCVQGASEVSPDGHCRLGQKR